MATDWSTRVPAKVMQLRTQDKATRLFLAQPETPGVSLGHNDSIAFAFTSFPIDMEDLYVYELNRANPTQYKYQGQWESFDIVHEKVRVKGQASVPVEWKFTRHGPVIYVDREKNRAFGVRTGWLEPGTASYFPSAEHMRSKTFEEYQKTVEKWGPPQSESHLCRYERKYLLGSARIRTDSSELGWLASGVWRRSLRVGGPIERGSVANTLQSTFGLHHHVE
jgi:hypothetical protein